MGFEYVSTATLSNFLDFELGLLKTDLHRNSQALENILSKIPNMENPSIQEIIADLKMRESILNEKIKYLVEEKAKIIQDVYKVKSSVYSLKKITVMIMAVTIMFTVASFVYLDSSIIEERNAYHATAINDGYVIQNLKGDTIDTWLSWRLSNTSTISVNLINGDKYPDMVKIVRKVVLSEETIDIDNSLLHKGPKGTTSTYYLGWAGALGSIQKQTKFNIPHKFNIIESENGEGRITISLTTQRNGDGYSGYTKSIADEEQNQILKSKITIYEVDKLSSAQFETILRHEFGHALGLAHSTASEDLMYPTITTDYPYISQCDIDAIMLLYDGGESSKIVCEN